MLRMSLGLYIYIYILYIYVYIYVIYHILLYFVFLERVDFLCMIVCVCTCVLAYNLCVLQYIFLRLCVSCEHTLCIITHKHFVDY